jgi:hypothetical protein
MEDLGVGRGERLGEAAGNAGDGAPVALYFLGERLRESSGVSAGTGDDDEKIPWLGGVEERVHVDIRGRDYPADYF